MKKIWSWTLGVVLVIALGFYIISNNTNAMPVAATANPDVNPLNEATGTTPSGTVPQTPPSLPPPPSPQPTGGAYKDGTYTGPVADAIYGQLQVAITVSGGKISDVRWPVYPDTPGHTTEVNSSALPQLKQETIAAQSADVNIISGATQTSEAFQQSLAAAVSQAK